MDMNRKLYRSSRDRMLCGVCGGIGEYLNVDPTLIRLVWAILACSGTGFLVYLLAAVIIPQEPDVM
jgi:phage shock protein C